MAARHADGDYRNNRTPVLPFELDPGEPGSGGFARQTNQADRNPQGHRRDQRQNRRHIHGIPPVFRRCLRGDRHPSRDLDGLRVLLLFRRHPKFQNPHDQAPGGNIRPPHILRPDSALPFRLPHLGQGWPRERPRGSRGNPDPLPQEGDRPCRGHRPCDRAGGRDFQHRLQSSPEPDRFPGHDP